VYGTLRRGSPNRYAQRLAQSSTYLGLARVRGRLVRLKHYPAVRLQIENYKWISGEVFRLHDPFGLLKTLDHYEGREFGRVAVSAIFADASRLPCWIYEYVGPHA
jgi:gamma-glutamylcyclotransferase (GGCT)/AIG2-like uncharacterized protein YtfP